MPRRDRALASGLLGFVAIIVIVALLYTLFEPAVTDIATMSADQTAHASADQAITDRQDIFGYLPLYGLFVAGVFIIAKAVVESRRPG